MNVTLQQVESAIAKMNQTDERDINDGSGLPGTWKLSDIIAPNIVDWINEEGNDEDNPYAWTESDIIAYINKTYPIAS